MRECYLIGILRGGLSFLNMCVCVLLIKEYDVTLNNNRNSKDNIVEFSSLVWFWEVLKEFKIIFNLF